jgi:hypothetical protein
LEGKEPMKKQSGIIFAVLVIGLTLFSTISARATDNMNGANALAIRVADILGLEHEIVAEAITQAKSDLRGAVLEKKADAARAKVEGLVAIGELTRLEADAKLAALSVSPLKKHRSKHNHNGKSLAFPILESKLDAMVTSGKLTHAEAQAKLTAIYSAPAKNRD